MKTRLRHAMAHLLRAKRAETAVYRSLNQAIETRRQQLTQPNTTKHHA